ARAGLDREVVRGLAVRTDGGAPCAGSIGAAKLVAEDGLEVDATYACPSSPGKVVVTYPMLDALAFGHRHVARVDKPGGTVAQVVYGPRPTLDVPTLGAGPSPAPSAAGAPTPTAPSSPSLATFAGRGALHALGGVDHVLALLGLLALRGRARAVV